MAPGELGAKRAARSGPVGHDDRMGDSQADEEDTYPARVVALLREHFSLDDQAADVVLRVLAAHRAHPAAGLEVIVDSPVRANWRLRAVREDLSRVYLADYRVPSNRPVHDAPAAAAVNAALAGMR